MGCSMPCSRMEAASSSSAAGSIAPRGWKGPGLERFDRQGARRAVGVAAARWRHGCGYVPDQGGEAAAEARRAWRFRMRAHAGCPVARALALQELGREVDIGLRARRSGNRRAITGRPCEGASLMRTLRGITVSKTLSLEEGADIGGDQLREVVPPVEHGQHDAVEVERGFSARRTRSMVRVIWLTPSSAKNSRLQRHQHRLRGDQGVQGEQAERGRAVEEDVVEGRPSASASAAKRVVQAAFAVVERRPARSRRRRGPGRRAAARGSGSRVGRMQLRQRRVAQQQGVGARAAVAAVEPRPVEALPCGSRSISSTRCSAASAVARLMAVVVLPTPPFWLAKAMIAAGRRRGQAGRGHGGSRSGGGWWRRGRCGSANRSAVHSASAARASVNSASAVRPFGKRATPPGARRRCAWASRSRRAARGRGR